MSMDLCLSTEPEVMQTMDASFTDLSSLCGQKRKAETILPADEEEEEEEESGKGEEESNSESDDQVWGFDSFDGSDYESPEEPPADEKEFEFRRYARHYHESQGFKVDDDMIPKSLHRRHGGLRGVDLDAHYVEPLTGRDYMEIMANVAIAKYNQVEKKTVTLDRIVRAVDNLATSIKAYITFMAKESPQGELVEYQAKAERKPWQRNIHPIFCRPSSALKKD
ncbi:PREDICTED: uncharacterized protein LOC104761066 isoform X2 [Camelina sativa]|uniref:Uncharacterized protein LOC104761066 isoform X2 n=1 Tax=Camelina sativa TaxID=90675 RepID=A0ABM0X8U3_CAMSA|nr:PREDICTED: uncharacterized protein LOC104761066 isoform X2 [Camelina sativa]